MSHIMLGALIVLLVLSFGCPVEAKEVKVEEYTVRCLVPATEMPKTHALVCEYLRQLTKAQKIKVKQQSLPFPHRPLRKGETIL